MCANTSTNKAANKQKVAGISGMCACAGRTGGGKHPFCHRAYLFQQLSKLSAFGISGAQALFRRDHGADAAAVSILG